LLLITLDYRTATASTLVVCWKTELFWMLCLSTRLDQSGMRLFHVLLHPILVDDIACVVDVALGAVDSTASLACC